jgi:hypothetical protein
VILNFYRILIPIFNLLSIIRLVCKVPELLISVLSFFIGIRNVEVDLSNQVVRILGSTPVKTMTEALEQTGRKARLIGQGVPEGSSLIFLLYHDL